VVAVFSWVVAACLSRTTADTPVPAPVPALVTAMRLGAAAIWRALVQTKTGFLRTQFDDGSWWVKSRTWPWQLHFDGQFPHGKDQWISAGATAWAAMALLFTIEPVKPAAAAPIKAEQE